MTVHRKTAAGDGLEYMAKRASRILLNLQARKERLLCACKKNATAGAKKMTTTIAENLALSAGAAEGAACIQAAQSLSGRRIVVGEIRQSLD
jgi:hypothetical protein